MIRITLLTLLIAYLSVYAWKDWFRAACWLVLLMAIFQHPDMPKAVADVPGLNHWNFLFINTVLAWLSDRKKKKLKWEMPSNINFLLWCYSLLIILSVVRYFSDSSGVTELYESLGRLPPSKLSETNEFLFNCFKWVIPGMIIFDGCRTRKQFDFAVIVLALMYILLALQVIKAMKIGSLNIGGDALQKKAIKIISASVGFHRVNMSMMLSGAFWAVFCLKEVATSKQYWLYILPGCFAIFLGMAMTGGRTGYGTWAILGMLFCIFKWRKYILLLPILIMTILAFTPSAIDRLTQGFSPEDESIDSTETNFAGESVDLNSVTSGRVFVWPIVWDNIKEAPLFGYGRIAMQNLGLTLSIKQEFGEGENFPHPHNAYLEWLLDNGFIGALPVFIFYFLMIKYAWSLFRDNTKKIYVATGGVAFSLLAAFLIASTGSQTFYPREGAVGMWVGIGLLLRIHIERKKKIKGISSLLIDG